MPRSHSSSEDDFAGFFTSNDVFSIFSDEVVVDGTGGEPTGLLVELDEELLNLVIIKTTAAMTTIAPATSIQVSII